MEFLKKLLEQLISAKIGASLSLVKIRAAIAYVDFIKHARHLTMLLCLLVLCTVVLACGFLVIPVALCLFMPWAPETKAIVAASFGAAYIIIPLITVMRLFSEKLWMKTSKADILLKRVLKK
jgi:hypothetical protein